MGAATKRPIADPIGIVFPSHMRKTKLVQTGEGGHFGYQKTFGDDFHASGYVEIQPGQEKPSKPSRDNAYVRILALARSERCRRAALGSLSWRFSS